MIENHIATVPVGSTPYDLLCKRCMKFKTTFPEIEEKLGLKIETYFSQDK